MKNLIFSLALLASCHAFALGDKPYNQGYDPKRDPFSDFKLAQQDAHQEGKLILIILGGDWCSWCHRLSSFIKKNESVEKELEETFIVMKLNVSEKNSNKDFLSYLPKPQGYPFFVIVNRAGEVIGALNTSGIEQGRSYSAEKFSVFINKWKNRKE